MPARCRVLLVHLLPHPGPLPVRARGPAGDVPGGQGQDRGSGAGLGGHRGRPGEGTPVQVRARARRAGPRHLGRGDRTGRGRARAHDQALRPGPRRRVLADPRDVDGLARLGRAVRLAARRGDAVLLRLVRGPARGLPAGVRRPDRRAGVRRLVGRRLPGHVGFQRPGHPHPGRALDDRGPLPRPEGGRGGAGLRGQREVRRRVAARPARHRRRAGHGDGPRHPAGVLRRPAGPVLHRLRQALHRPAVPGPAGRSTGTPTGPGSSSPRPTSSPRRTPRTRRSRPCCSTR